MNRTRAGSAAPRGLRGRVVGIRTWIAIVRDRTPRRAERQAFAVTCSRCATSFRPAYTDGACPVCGCTDDVPTWGRHRGLDRQTQALGLVVGATVANLLVLATVAILLLS